MVLQTCILHIISLAYWTVLIVYEAKFIINTIDQMQLGLRKIKELCKILSLQMMPMTLSIHGRSSVIN